MPARGLLWTRSLSIQGITETAIRRPGSEIRECPQFIGCRGGNVTGEYCAAGYESALCATCEPGFFMSSWKTCERCESSEKWVHMAMGFSLIAVLVAVTSATRRKQFATLWEFIWTSCASGSLARFLPKLLFMTLVPIALGGVIMARCLFQVHVWKLERRSFQKRALRLFLLMCYFVLPATSTTIFRTFL